MIFHHKVVRYYLDSCWGWQTTSVHLWVSTSVTLHIQILHLVFTWAVANNCSHYSRIATIISSGTFSDVIMIAMTTIYNIGTTNISICYIMSQRGILKMPLKWI